MGEPTPQTQETMGSKPGIGGIFPIFFSFQIDQKVSLIRSLQEVHLNLKGIKNKNLHVYASQRKAESINR